jgi:trimethylamine--corrinoid protein Co-methyltransferase
MGGVFTILDLKTMVFSYGAPELLLMDAALSDIAKWLSIPVFSTAGCSDSKVFDQQAGMEAGVSILMAAQSGANLIHDVGYLESGLLGSLDMLVCSNEAVALAKRIMRGIRVDEETLAIDVMEEVGPGNHFFDSDHTLRHFRNEVWVPDLIDRSNLANWELGGRKTMGDRVHERVRQILKEHQALPLDKKLVAELKKIIKKADEKYAG